MSKKLMPKHIKEQFKQRFPKATITVYEAPAAEHWVVIVDDVAWVADQSLDEFVFWGPKGKDAICF